MRILRSQYFKQQQVEPQKCTNTVKNTNNLQKSANTDKNNGASEKNINEHRFHIPAGQHMLAMDLPERQHRIVVNIINTTNEDTPPIDVIVKFFDPDTAWFTRFYYLYESQLWTKYPRDANVRHKRWYFKCEICSRIMCSFYDLKAHLNAHLGFYPNACNDCSKRFTNRATLRKHYRFKHIFQQ